MEATRDVCFANETPHIQFPEFHYLKYEVLTGVIIEFLVVINIMLILVWCYNKLKAMRKPPVVQVERRVRGRTRRLPKQLSQSCPKICYTSSKNVDDLNEDDLEEIAKRENENAASQESPNGYSFGGYMPIDEGDVLDRKYEVCRKLGYGQFSTVWLCQNKLTKNYVAIKMCKSHGSQTALALDEIRILKRTKARNPNHPGFRNIIQMFGYFWDKSINGNHTAIVLEVMGPSLLHLMQLSECMGLEITGVRTIIKQVLRGLEYLHNECGIIHTDLKPANILIKPKGAYVQHMVKTTKKFQEYGIALPKTYVTSERWCEFQQEVKETGSYAPARTYSDSSYTTYKSAAIDVYKKQPDSYLKVPLWINPNIEVKIGDMGNATWVKNKYLGPIQTRQYRALEVIMGAGYDCPADIWSVGCMAFELATGEYLFGHRDYRYNETSLDVKHVALIWEVLDGIPHYITMMGSKADLFFADGQLRHIPKSRLRIWKIEDILQDKYNWNRVDAMAFAGFIYSLIEPDPTLRATASAALNREWINE